MPIISDRRTRRRFLCAAIALGCGTIAAAAGANDMLLQSLPPSPPATTVSDGAQPMVLEVVVNATDTHELLNVERAPDGSFSARAGDLRRLRLKLAPSVPADSMVRLRDLPGVVARYDEANQTLSLEVANGMLQNYEVSLGGEPTPTDLKAMKPIGSAILNYGLYDTNEAGHNYVSGNFEGLLTNSAGIFSTTALYNQAQSGGYSKSVRLDSSWRYIDAARVRSYTLGDFVSNALSWNNSVRLVGFQISSAFDQRPDIVTAALPQFSGAAALPSTLDLYVNQQRVFSGEVPSGPYLLKSLPYVSGGDVTLVTTDATGRQVTSTQAYYYNAQQLRQGLFEYSLDIGAPRLNYGLKSSDYDNVFFGAGSVRYGLTNTTTLEGHVESSSDGLANLGGGIVQGLGGYGTVSASLAGSHYKSYSGGQAALNVEGLFDGIQFFAGAQRSIDDYFDLARVSSYRYLRRYPDATTVSASPVDADAPGLPIATVIAQSTAQAQAIDRAGISFKPWFDETSISLSYNRIKYAGDSLRTANLSLSRSLTRKISVFANAYTDLDHSHDRGVYLTFNIQLGSNITADATVSDTNGHMGYTQEVNALTGQRQGDVGWGVSNTFYGDAPDQRDAYITYHGSTAQLRAEVYQYGSATRTDLSAQGSLVAAGGGVFAANQIGNAYAIVTNAGPHAEVMQGGVDMGQADSHGRALLPDITPYYEQHIFIDPSTSPDGWEAATTEQVAIAGYRQGTIVDFGAKVVHGAVLILHGKDGKPIAPGYTAQMEGGESAVVGYDGQTYVRDLKPHNRVSVDLGAAGTCTANFDYDPNGPAQPQIGPLTCQ